MTAWTTTLMLMAVLGFVVVIYANVQTTYKNTIVPVSHRFAHFGHTLRGDNAAEKQISKAYLVKNKHCSCQAACGVNLLKKCHMECTEEFTPIITKKSRQISVVASETASGNTAVLP